MDTQLATSLPPCKRADVSPILRNPGHRLSGCVSLQDAPSQKQFGAHIGGDGARERPAKKDPQRAAPPPRRERVVGIGRVLVGGGIWFLLKLYLRELFFNGGSKNTHRRDSTHPVPSHLV